MPNPGKSSAPFGAESRSALIADYVTAHPGITVSNAWEHVYRLLLWVDPTTGLAHCYESDKCQPGRPWYARSLVFHEWLAAALGCGTLDVRGEIDWLFRSACDLIARVDTAEALKKAAKQREAFPGTAFPVPGEDPELEAIVSTVLGSHLKDAPRTEEWAILIRSVREYVALENKRKNLLGEGFEDVLAALLGYFPHTKSFAVHNRVLVGEIDGFNPQSPGEKAKKVDLAISSAHGPRALVTAKWSIRSDREEQFRADLETYAKLNSGSIFRYILVTNEFDAARLVRACSAQHGHNYLFSKVVHVNPKALAPVHAGAMGFAEDLGEQQANGRLISLEEWLTNPLA